MSEHSLFSPSGAKKWMLCAASLLAEKPYPSTSNSYADEGTAAHTLAAHCLQHNEDPHSWVGKIVPVGDSNVEVDEDFAENVGTYVDAIRIASSKTPTALLFLEERVEFGRFIGVDDQSGTSDAIILSDFEDGYELQVHDLKFGRGVRESAADPDGSPNKQMALYALGALAMAQMIGRVTRISLHIHQPRLSWYSRHEMSLVELYAFGDGAKAAAAKAKDIYDTTVVGLEDYTPGDDQCRFCKAKSGCPALAAKVQDALGADFDDISAAGVKGEDALSIAIGRGEDRLPAIMRAAAQIEGFVRAARAETERRLLAGIPVEGFTLVQGRKGARAWVSAEEAEATLKRMRVKEADMYTKKVISPTAAEKLVKAGKLGDKQWASLGEQVVQRDGAPSVVSVLELGNRAPLVIRSVDDFENVEMTAEDLV